MPETSSAGAIDDPPSIPQSFLLRNRPQFEIPNHVGRHPVSFFVPVRFATAVF
jgi:hypothetical protein